MRSLRYAGHGRVALVDVPDPQPAADEALVRVEASAICGSERHSLLAGNVGNAGHEACGTVVDPGRSGFRVGDRVGLSAIVGCGKCDACLAGRQLHCRDWRFSARVGWHAELATVHVDALYAIPGGVDATLGVMLTGDSLGVPGRGLRLAPTDPGDDVVVIGLGPIGLGHVLVRTFTGARVSAIEPVEYRRQLGLDLGAVQVLAPGEPVDVEPRVVIECTGRPDCIASAFELVANGGVVLQCGEHDGDVPVNPSSVIIQREITYAGSWYFAQEDYDDMLALFAAGLPLSRMLTHEVLAEDAPDAVADFLAGRSGKVVLRWDLNRK